MPVPSVVVGSDEKRIVVVGAGVAGLGAALALSRDGHQVTLLERDATPLPSDPSAAFEWDRRGAPQVRHSHAFLARLHNLLRTSYPDVLADLLAAGATEIRMAENLPPTMTDWTPRPGDEDLVMLACRRTTFEWVLRRSVLASPRCSIRDGVAAEGLLGSPGADGIPVVTGVRTSAGDFPADLTVVAGGRRSTLPDWLAEIGADPVPEEVEDTGIVYYSRFYELLPGAEPPPRTARSAATSGISSTRSSRATTARSRSRSRRPPTTPCCAARCRRSTRSIRPQPCFPPRRHGSTPRSRGRSPTCT